MKGEKAQKGTLKKVLRYIRPYWPLVAFSILLAAVTVAASLYIPILTGNAVDLILGPGQVDFAGIFKILVEICVIIAIAALAQWLMSLFNNRITYRVVRDIRNKAFDQLQKLPLKYLDGHPTGQIVSRVIADVDQFADGLLMGFTQLFTGVITILGTLGFMLTVSGTITAVVVVITRCPCWWRPSSPSGPTPCSGCSPRCGGSRPALWRRWWGARRWCRLPPRGGDHGALRPAQRGAAPVQPAGHLLLLHHQPLHPVVNSLVYTGVGIVGALLVISGGTDRGTAVLFPHLRQPVHQAL